MEAEDLDLGADNYIYCVDCNEEYVEECLKHGPLQHIPDSQAKEEAAVNQEYAKSTVPSCLRVAPSAIKNAGLGVWTTETIAARSYFGPYRGDVLSELSGDSYGWKVRKTRNGIKHVYIDASDPSKSNWMRYVNCARSFHEQNLVAYQYKGNVYYSVMREIPRHSELYVYYSDEGAEECGIDALHYFDELTKPLPVETFSCEICQHEFSSPIERDEHAPQCQSTPAESESLSENETQSSNQVR